MTFSLLDWNELQRLLTRKGARSARAKRFVGFCEEHKILLRTKPGGAAKKDAPGG
jgi:hypothetical protein